MNGQESTIYPQSGNGPITLSGESNAQRVTAGSKAVWKLVLKPRQTGKMRVRVLLNIVYGSEDSPEWDISINDNSNKLWESAKLTPPDVEFNMEGLGGKELRI